MKKENFKNIVLQNCFPLNKTISIQKLTSFTFYLINQNLWLLFVRALEVETNYTTSAVSGIVGNHVSDYPFNNWSKIFMCAVYSRTRFQ